MAKKANGTAKTPMSAQQNGSIAPSAASHTTASTTTTSTTSTPKSTRSSRRRHHKRSYSGWLVDKSAKLLIWYSLITVLFRCPSSQDDLYASSPKVCKGYLQARDYITPYTQPYYNQHLAPYVQQAQPYFDRFNTQVYTPGHALYQQHAAPRVAQAQKIGYEQWGKTVKPQLDVARHHAGKQYEAVLGPYVNKAYDSVNPHYQSLKTSASDIWDLELQPVYRKTAPYTQKLFTQGRKFAVDTALPQAQYASSAAWSFWIRQIWPKIRVLYGENVEPQLMRITERLGRYRDEKKVEAEVKSMEKSSSIVEASSTAVSSASSVSSAASEAAKGASSASSVAAEPSASVDPRESFLKDLKSWEQVCAKAVDEGTEHLKERIDEITSHQQKRQVEGVGKSLVVQLEDTVEGVINSSKARILAIVGGIPEEATDDDIEEAQIALATAIRSAGQNVKARAQAIREWHQAYSTETTDLINKALESTLETVDGIRELRLTEIDYFRTNVVSDGKHGYTEVDLEGVERTQMGWEVYPEGLRHLLVGFRRDYPNLPPIYITENGMATDDKVVNGEVDDHQRISFLRRHLAAVDAAVKEGVDVRGYFIWSLMDNFEWAFGYERRFGMIHVDYATQKRTLKRSAKLVTQFLAERDAQ